MLKRERPQHSRWKSPKCNRGRISDMKWITITGKQAKCSGKTVWRLCGRRSHPSKSIKHRNGVLVSNEKDILGRWREYFRNLLNPVTITPPNTRGAFVGVKHHLHCIQNLLCFQNAEGCRLWWNPRPKMLKALNQGVIWLTRVLQMAWSSGRTPTDWQTNRDYHPHTQKGRQKWMH